MSALENYSATSERCKAFLDLERKLRGEKIIGHSASNDLLRAAVILNIAAMDHYFRCKFVEMLPSLIKSERGREALITEVNDDLFTKSKTFNREAVEIINNGSYIDLKKKFDYFLSHYTYGKMKRINKLFLCYGVDALSETAETNSQKKDLLKEVTSLVKRRNNIAHTGDLTKTGVIKEITRSNITKKLNCVDKYVECCDEILNNSSKIFC